MILKLPGRHPPYIGKSHDSFLFFFSFLFSFLFCKQPDIMFPAAANYWLALDFGPRTNLRFEGMEDIQRRSLAPRLTELITMIYNKFTCPSMMRLKKELEADVPDQQR